MTEKSNSRPQELGHSTEKANPCRVCFVTIIAATMSFDQLNIFEITEIQKKFKGREFFSPTSPGIILADYLDLHH